MLLEAKDLKKVYAVGQFNRQVTAVDHFNLNIDCGEFVYITGRSGSGKSTAMNMMVGLLKPTSGSVIINGVDLWSQSDSQISALRNFNIGYVPQGVNLLSDFTVIDNIRLPFYIQKRSGNCDSLALKLLYEVGLQEHAMKFPSELSGGEMRRIAIARAMINQPQLLVADEPTGDLDDQTSDEIMRLFDVASKKGIAVILVTHDLHLSTKFGSTPRICEIA